jgi:hypothetical protein
MPSKTGTGRTPLATLPLLTSALIIAGCGGNGDGHPTASIKSVQTTTTPSIASGLPASRVGKRPPAKHRAAQPGPAAGGGLAQALQRASARVPQGQRSQAVRGVARMVLAQYGFAAAQVTVRGNAQDVLITLSSRQACTALDTTQANIANLLRKAIPWLRSAELQAQTGEPLVTYVRTHCQGPTLPTGRGPVVLTQRGTNAQTSASFTIRSGRWSIEYFNGGDELQIYVTGGGRTPATLNAYRRMSGRYAPLNGPGTYKLRITGTGEWLVRARDGV